MDDVGHQLQGRHHGVDNQAGLHILVRIELLAWVGLHLRQVGGPGGAIVQ